MTSADIIIKVCKEYGYSDELIKKCFFSSPEYALVKSDVDKELSETQAAATEKVFRSMFKLSGFEQAILAGILEDYSADYLKKKRSMN